MTLQFLAWIYLLCSPSFHTWTITVKHFMWIVLIFAKLDITSYSDNNTNLSTNNNWKMYYMVFKYSQILYSDLSDWSLKTFRIIENPMNENPERFDILVNTAKEIQTNIGGIVISNCACEKRMGIKFDSILMFQPYIRFLSRRASQKGHSLKSKQRSYFLVFSHHLNSLVL